MSETENKRPVGTGSSDSDSVKLVYLLNFASFVVGITALIGVVIAYLKRGDADPIAASHFTFQIRTFWISILAFIVGALLMMVMIGFLVWLAWLVWAIIRNVKGFMAISEGKPIAEPETWLW
ncbi:MAG: hypothetical protein RLN89_05245 [Parvibaculum sp.]